MMVTETLEHLQLNNLNLDFTNVFVKEIKKLNILELINKNSRSKVFDDNELRSIIRNLPNIKHLFMNKGPIKDKSLGYILPYFSNLGT